VIYVGTCGYGYKDWAGSFYPATVAPKEMLPYYARHFCAVEIDASYYGVPSAATMASMQMRSPGEFRFSFKAPRTVTHPQRGTARVHDDARLLRERLEPLRAAGKLAAVLVQFPNAFKPDAASETYLAAVARAFAGVALVAEFRHRDWQRAQTFELLRDLDVGWSNVDLPELETLPRVSADAVGPVGYVRFHGRNARQWWTGTNVTRYDYSYTMDELAPWADRVLDVAAQTQQTFAFFNNHARGRAAENAQMFERLLRDRAGRAVARPTLPPAPAQRPLPGWE
jgi:uncharacterized protein YecE (DUF72 family)